MLTRTIASYTEKNTNSKIGVQGAMLVSTNIDNSEEVEDDSNKKSKKRQGWKRKNVTPDQDIEGSKERKVPSFVMWYLPVIDCLKYMFSNPMDAELLFCHMNARQMERFDNLRMADCGNNLILLIRRTSLMIQEISGLGLAHMEWVHSERWGTHTVRDQLLCAYSISHHGCATNKIIFYSQPSYPVLNKLTMA
jgi:hypothetical protein